MIDVRCFSYSSGLMWPARRKVSSSARRSGIGRCPACEEDLLPHRLKSQTTPTTKTTTNSIMRTISSRNPIPMSESSMTYPKRPTRLLCREQRRFAFANRNQRLCALCVKVAGDLLVVCDHMVCDVKDIGSPLMRQWPQGNADQLKS